MFTSFKSPDERKPMNWKKHFREIILDRGYDYFLDGCVCDLKIGADRYTATVW